MPSITKVWSYEKILEAEQASGQRLNLPSGTDLYLPSSANLAYSLSRSYPKFTNQSTREISARRSWRRAIALAQDATTNVSLDKSSCLSLGKGEFGCIFINKPSPPSQTTYWSLIRGEVVSGAGPVSPIGDPTDLYNINTIKFLQRCVEVQRRFSGGVFMGELRETIKMITRPGKKIVNALHGHKFTQTKYLRNLKGGKYVYGRWIGNESSSRRAKDIISNGWLQLQFGIKPLLNDLDEGMQATAEFFNHVPRERVSFTSKQLFPTTSTSAILSMGILRYRERTNRKSLYKVTTRGAVKVDGPTKTNPAFLKHFGLSWQDAVLTGWELIPYSFVIDYFANIGDFLEASLFPQASLAWCNRTTNDTHSWEKEVLRDSFTNSLVAPGTAGLQYVWEGKPSLLYQRRILTRTRNVVLIPQLALRVPGVGSLKWLNLAALATGRI